ncbi:1D-myo-inositol 2-acetamido-2-deoxy-alpha-D-glucopyranoside deacetylase [bacterium HR15]|nr:1D-myo-inositol 2-acetamido-2-deoxy-alpha-D-glucopyranoside deacetylase [bacterium HR15]
MAKRWAWRVTLALGGLLGSYVGMSCLLFVLGAHRASLSQQSEHWQVFSLPESSQRLLIVAPHPDDEVLGCGGLIATAVRQGAQVRVVFLTNGDGYPAAATLLCRSTPTAHDFLALGKLRMQEARQAARALGLSLSDLLFLGYPDRQLWQMAIAGKKPLRAPATQCDHVPYTEALRPGAPYCAPSLVEDLRRVISDFQPTHLFVTHPLDDHPDHMVASLYVREALAQATERGELLIAPQLFYYLIHRGDWPLPQGYSPERSLVPPRGMTAERWLCLPLDAELRERKRRALRAHESQYALMARFLNSFLRTNELFLPEGEWVRNPVDDNPMLRLRPGGDLRQVRAEPDSGGIRLQIETRRPLTAPLRLQITLILVEQSGEWRTRTWLYTPARSQAFEGVVEAQHDRLRFWLPVPEMRHVRRAYLLVQSHLYQVELDRSGILPIRPALSGEQAGVAVDAPSRATAQQSAPLGTR